MYKEYTNINVFKEILNMKVIHNLILLNPELAYSTFHCVIYLFSSLK